MSTPVGVWVDEINRATAFGHLWTRSVRYPFPTSPVAMRSTAWNAATAPDPIDDIRTAMEKVLDAPMRPGEFWPVHPSRVPKGRLPVPLPIARLLPPPRPPAEVARQWVLLNPTVED